jgi:hypothetical protein
MGQGALAVTAIVGYGLSAQILGRLSTIVATGARLGTIVHWVTNKERAPMREPILPSVQVRSENPQRFPPREQRAWR